MKTLNEFCKGIKGFYDISSGEQIKYFVYFLQKERELEPVASKNILDCFNDLHINPYSNIPRFLRENSKKKKGVRQQFLQRGKGYILLASVREEIDTELGTPVEIVGTDSLYPLSIFDNTRDYLNNFAKEASVCYDQGLYNSCLLMLRKIMETLIVDLYESKKIQAKIINKNGDYLQLKGLINCVLLESSWKLTKTTKEHLPKLKLYADSSAHSKRFNARKPDIDKLKEDTRIIFEELISHINYSNFKN